MPAQEKSALRVILPLVVVVAGTAFVLVTMFGSPPPSGQPTSAPGGAQQTAQTTPDSTSDLDESPVEAASGDAGGQDIADDSVVTLNNDPESVQETPTQTGATTTSPSQGASTTQVGSLGLHALTAGQPGILTPIGSLDPATGYRAKIAFTPWGAGVEAITLTDFFRTIERKEHYALQSVRTWTGPGGEVFQLTSLAARQITIDGQAIDLISDPVSKAPIWRELSPGSFECMIVDENETPVMRLTRTFSIAPGSFEISVQQHAENLTDRSVSVMWVQYGPIDLPEDIGGYRIKIRRVRFGYLWDSVSDPSQQFVHADTRLRRRQTIIDRVVKKQDAIVWPRPSDYKRAHNVTWVAQTSRYFVFSVHPLIDGQSAAANVANPTANPVDKSLDLATEIRAITWSDQTKPGEYTLLLQMSGSPQLVSAGQTLDLSFGAYAGPLGRRQLSSRENPVYGAMGLDDMVIYNIGGPCAFCTFQWLAKFLIGFLTILHDRIVYDWALAVMLLVVCVRSILHPITKRSQIGIMRFSKQMQGLAPKQAKLRERYKDDSKRLNQEMMKLMKEEGVSYTGMLGCLPMFLQTPVWIALYAMLYFSFDLRHEAAFYGVFQSISGGAWPFLADLSSADNFIPFGSTSFSIPLMGIVTGFNILPIMLGVVFFLQQKYLTPPPTGNMTPEQQAQQKMMKVMLVVMFPVLMYNAPSGLTIYFITNSTLGIFESRYIRSHIDKADLESPDKPASPGKKKVKSKSQQPTSPFKKDRSEYRQEFKRKK